MVKYKRPSHKAESHVGTKEYLGEVITFTVILMSLTLNFVTGVIEL